LNIVLAVKITAKNRTAKIIGKSQSREPYFTNPWNSVAYGFLMIINKKIPDKKPHNKLRIKSLFLEFMIFTAFTYLFVY